jgi:transposase
MCLKPKPLSPIPQETRHLAQQLYAPDHPLRRLGEEYADFVRDEDFIDLYSHTGQPALSPWLLALVTVLQAMEHCSDRLAAEMVRSRIDWKYALHLPLAYPGFDPSVLCEFRQRLVAHQAQRRIFDALLQRFKDKGLLKGRAVQRTDSMAIMTSVRELNRLELVMETLRLALEAIAKADLHWIRSHVPAQWLETYGSWTQGERLIRETGALAATETRRLILQTGQDGFALLDALEAADGAALRSLNAVVLLRTVWSQQYQRTDLHTSVTPLDGTGVQHERLAEPSEEPGATPKDAQPASLQLQPASAIDDGQRRHILVTPHDPQARRATKRGLFWNGYKLHLTETAAEDAPLVITDLEVGAAAAYDCHALAAIQERLHTRDLLPATHLADAGYVNGPTLHHSQERHVELLGPVPADTYGTFRQERIWAAEAFEIDVENRHATCPGGHSNRRWSVYHRSGGEDRDLIALLWDKQVCQRCPLKNRCLPAGQSHRVLRLSRYYTLLTARRREQKTPAFRERYRRRAGVEATFSHLVNVQGARRTPYRGPDKTLGYYAALATAVNLRRVVAWQVGERPKRERRSRLHRILMEWSAQAAHPTAV